MIEKEEAVEHLDQINVPEVDKIQIDISMPLMRSIRYTTILPFSSILGICFLISRTPFGFFHLCFFRIIYSSRE